MASPEGAVMFALPALSLMIVIAWVMTMGSKLLPILRGSVPPPGVAGLSMM
jgi:hypothetical protein